MDLTGAIPPRRAAFLVLLLALASFGNSVAGGFAYDDHTIIRGHPVVTEGRIGEVFTSPYWPQVIEGAGLYRPLMLASYTAEWGLWGGDPRGFHLVNVVAHGVVSLLVFLLLLSLSSPLPALVGGALFAVHPVHTEAVANVVGRAEIYAALFVIGACLAFRSKGDSTPYGRVARLLAIGALYVLGLGSKEMAATLPGLLVLLAVFQNAEGTAVRRVWSDAPVFLLSAVLLGAFLGARTLVLRSVAGDLPASYLLDLSTGQRILTSLSVWPHYFRLLFVPLDLVADYGPAVLFPALTWGPDVGLGLLMIVTGALAMVLLWTREPLISLGIAWFAVSILPVTNLLVPTGVLLAERTLYLPSVGLAIAAAGVVRWTARERPRSLGLLLAAFGLICSGFMIRTVVRNPAWMSTFTMLSTLEEEHPESFRAIRARAQGLDQVGEYEDAARNYEVVLELVPHEYSVLVEVARFHGRRENWTEAERLLSHAIELVPDIPLAWQVLSRQRLLQGRGREGHRIALQGLAIVGSNRDLWMLVSESYVAKGDYEAAIRARWASFAAAPDTSDGWGRMAELMTLAGHEEDALAARQRAERLAREEADEAGRRPGGRAGGTRP